jgi:hypothetical protein
VSRTVAIVQSCYIPWKGYFDLIASCDQFILYDDAQYTKRDWRNRNRIKTPHGLLWLSIPVNVSGRYFQPIRDVTVSDGRWNTSHWKTIASNYARAPYFREYKDALEDLYLGARESSLSAINHRFLAGICGLLGIRTRISWSMEYPSAGAKTERLVDLCRQAGATRYISGPSAKAYIDADLFAQAGIELRFIDYSGYPPYTQLFPPFEHRVSVVDLLFNVGPAAREHLAQHVA